MFFETPAYQEVIFFDVPLSRIGPKLKRWNPAIELDKLKLIGKENKTWNDGSLGCPMPGMCYTKAIVYGYRLLISCGDAIFEVHTDHSMEGIAIPGVGFLY